MVRVFADRLPIDDILPELDAAQLMALIARGLISQQVLAVAAYLGSLEYSLRAFERRSSGRNPTLGTHGRESGLRWLLDRC